MLIWVNFVLSFHSRVVGYRRVEMVGCETDKTPNIQARINTCSGAESLILFEYCGVLAY
jgi:hypothetical protein